jgi:signal transduction histidine kinase
MQKQCLAIFFLTFLKVLLFGQSTSLVKNLLVLNEEVQEFSLAGNEYVYQGHTENQTPATISMDSSHFYLFNGAKQPLKFSDGQNTFWIRFKTTNNFSFDKEFILFLSMRWDTIDFYSTDGNKLIHQVTGSLLPISKRGLPMAYPAVSLLLKKGTEQTFYARYTYKGTYSAPTTFAKKALLKASYLKQDAEDKLIQGLFLGIVFIMALYNLFLYFSIRDINYVYYVLLLVSYGLVFMQNWLYDDEYLWPNSPVFAKFHHETTLIDFFISLAVFLFATSFLDAKRTLPKLYFFLLFLLTLSGGVFLVSVFKIVDKDLTWLYSSMVGIVILSTILITGIVSYRKGNKAASYFVIGNVFSALGTIGFLLQSSFHLVDINLKTYPMQIGLVLDMLFFSLALANKLNNLKEETEKQQMALIAEKYEKEQIRVVTEITTQENERLRLAKDIHDDLGSGLSKIKFLSEIVFSKSNAYPEIKTHIKSISDTSSLLVENMRDLIWALNPENTTLDGLAASIREYTSDYLGDFPLSLSFDFPENIPDHKITKEAHRNIFQTVKECLQNIVKHSHASAVRITVVVTEFHLLVKIADNGVGLDNQTPTSGNGIRNIQLRMADIGGKVDFLTGQQKGLEVVLAVPVFSIQKT